MTQPVSPFGTPLVGSRPVAVSPFGTPLAQPTAAPGLGGGIDWGAIQAREAQGQGQAGPDPDAAAQAARAAALREEIGLADTIGVQAARGALDALLAPGALVGAGAQALGSVVGSETVERFGRDLGRASSGKAAAEALGFVLGGGDTDRADRARIQVERQEEARPTLAAISRMAGMTAFGLGLGAGSGASTVGRTIAANALEGAAGGAQAAYENEQDAPLRDVLTSAAVGALLGGGLAGVGEGVSAGVGAVGRKIRSGELDKVFGKVQQFADERMIKTAIGNDAKTMRLLTNNGRDMERINRVAARMREANLPSNLDEMHGVVEGHLRKAADDLTAVGADLDAAGLRPNATELFGKLQGQANDLRQSGVGRLHRIADALDSELAPFRERLAIKQADDFGNEVVTGYRDPTFTDLRRLKMDMGRAVKFAKRDPSIADDELRDQWITVARELDSVADAAGPEAGAKWRAANRSYHDWKDVSDGIEEEMQRRLKNRFISPSDYGTGIAGALMTMIATGGAAIPALAAGAATAIGHRALRYGGSKIAEGLANRLAKVRFHVPLSKAGGPEAQQVAQQVGRMKRFMNDTAERAGDNPTVRETASNAAREVSAEAMAKAAGDFDPANWAKVNPIGKVVHRGAILDAASRDIAAATERGLSLRAPIPETIQPQRVARLVKDADGPAAIGSMQQAVTTLFDGVPATSGGSIAAHALRRAADELSRADVGESFLVGHRLATQLERAGRVAADPDLDLVAARGLDGLDQLRSGMREESLARVRAEYGSGKPMQPVDVTIYPDGKVSLQDGRHRVAVAKELGVAAIPARVSRMDETGEIINETTGMLPISPGKVTRDAAAEAEANFFDRAALVIRETLGGEAFGSAGRQYRSLVATPPQTAEILRNPEALREALRELKTPGQISFEAAALAKQVADSFEAAQVFGGARISPQVKDDLAKLLKVANEAEDAVTLDGAPMGKVFDLVDDGPKKINPETEVLEQVDRAIAPVVPMIKNPLNPLRVVPGKTRLPESDPKEQNRVYTERFDTLTKAVAQPESLDLEQVQGGTTVTASLATKLQQLIADMPKPVDTIRGKQPLSSEELRRANAMWEATLEPLSVFQDFAHGTVDYDKARYAWKQYPGLQQAAQAGVMDVITNELDDQQRSELPDPLLTQLDYLLGFGGKLQPNVDPAYAARMSSLPDQEQKDKPKPGGMLELPGSEPTPTQRTAQVL